MTPRNRHLNRPLMALAATALLAVGGAHAATSSSAGSYAAQREACMAKPKASQAPCIREIGAAADAARHGQLSTPNAEQLKANARERCTPLPPDQREACLRRAEGEGTQVGTVEDGGVLRELVVRSPQPVPPNPQYTPVLPTAPAR